MAAKGSILKQKIAEKILSTFPGSFLYNDGKEIRINGEEEGQFLQIKVSLTCAKVAVTNDNDTDIIEDTKNISTSVSADGEINTNVNIPQEPSEEEKERLASLLAKLGL